MPLYCATVIMYIYYVNCLYSPINGAIHHASIYYWFTFSNNLHYTCTCTSNRPLRSLHITQCQALHPKQTKNYTLTFIMIIEEAKVMRTKIMALNQWYYMHVVIAPIHSIDCSWSVNARQIFIHFPQLSPVESWIDDSNSIRIGFNIDWGWIRLQIRKCLW